VRQKYADHRTGLCDILIFAHNRKENAHTNQYLLFPLNKCARNVKMLCCDIGPTVYVNIDGKSICYEGLRTSQFRDCRA
jgi:hypothetical protein